MHVGRPGEALNVPAAHGAQTLELAPKEPGTHEQFARLLTPGAYEKLRGGHTSAAVQLTFGPAAHHPAAHRLTVCGAVCGTSSNNTRVVPQKGIAQGYACRIYI